jgi:hypothetical protein
MSGDTVPLDHNEEITAKTVEKFVETYFSDRKIVKAEVSVRHLLLCAVDGLNLLIRVIITMNCKHNIMTRAQFCSSTTARSPVRLQLKFIIPVESRRQGVSVDVDRE